MFETNSSNSSTAQVTKTPRANCTNNNYCSLMMKQKLSYFVTKKDKIRNEDVRGSVKVASVRKPLRNGGTDMR